MNEGENPQNPVPHCFCKLLRQFLRSDMLDDKHAWVTPSNVYALGGKMFKLMSIHLSLDTKKVTELVKDI